jgi:hypothetical protein
MNRTSPSICIAVTRLPVKIGQSSTYGGDAVERRRLARARRVVDIRQLTDVLRRNLQHHLSCNCIRQVRTPPRAPLIPWEALCQAPRLLRQAPRF